MKDNSTLTIGVKLLLISYFCLLIPGLVSGQQSGQELLIQTACFKSAAVHPTAEFPLDPQISEGSGLIAWNGKIWTHNDSDVPCIFALDSISGGILQSYDLPIKNIDWEDMSQDNNFLYLGNFGNNRGLRDTLKVYRISKESLIKDKIALDSLSFEWPLVTDFGKEHQVNFDCEAMVVIRDTIYLFTKEWKPRLCSRIFKIPATPGNHTAEYVATLKTRFLITGATYSPVKNRIVLCGYSILMKPRLLAFPVPDSGNLKDIKKGTKIRMRKKLKQIEGVTSFNGDDYYLISEATKFLLWDTEPTLYKIKITK
jgi:hypothetical protein